MAVLLSVSELSAAGAVVAKRRPSTLKRDRPLGHRSLMVELIVHFQCDTSKKTLPVSPEIERPGKSRGGGVGTLLNAASIAFRTGHRNQNQLGARSGFGGLWIKAAPPGRCCSLQPA